MTTTEYYKGIVMDSEKQRSRHYVQVCTHHLPGHYHTVEVKIGFCGSMLIRRRVQDRKHIIKSHTTPYEIRELRSSRAMFLMKHVHCSCHRLIGYKLVSKRSPTLS
jgi:hypothetical protein